MFLMMPPVPRILFSFLKYATGYILAQLSQISRIPQPTSVDYASDIVRLVY